MEPKIGETLHHSEASKGKRDAFHVPAVLVTSTNPVTGGQRVTFTAPNIVTPAKDDTMSVRYRFDAVVDPFLGVIPSGNAFWVFLRPGTVSNLTHTWTAPTIAELQNPVDAAPPLTNEEAKILKLVKDSNVTEEELDEWVNDSCRGCYN